MEIAKLRTRSFDTTFLSVGSVKPIPCQRQYRLTPHRLISRCRAPLIPRLGTWTAFLDCLFQHLPEFRCVLMAMHLHRMLHGNFDQLLFTVGGYGDGAF